MRCLVDSLPSMLAYWDRDLRCRFANRAYLVWFGVDPDELLGRHIQELLGDELYALNRPYIEGALRGETQTFERAVPGPHGKLRQSLASYLPDWRDGEVVGFFVQVTEVTALKETEYALRREVAERQRTEAELREVQRLAGLGSWEWDCRREVMRWSQQMYRVFGRDSSQPPPTRDELQRYYPPHSRRLRDAAIEAALADGEPYALEVEFIREDGSTGWLLTRGEPVRDESGAIIGLRGAAQDVSERHEAEALRRERDQARASNEAKTEFLSRVSHELRTPLNAVIGFAQLLMMAPDTGNRQRSWAEQIARSGNDLLGMVEGLLDLSVAEHGAVDLRVADVDLHDVLESACAAARDRYAAAEVALRVRLPAGRPLRVRADRHRLEQVVAHLLSNACNFNRAGGHVAVSARADGASVAFSVEDTGCGMHARQLSSLFTPFDRLGAEDTTIPGSGLGLALTKRLVEAMAGSMAVVSQPEVGSTFTVRLPAASY